MPPLSSFDKTVIALALTNSISMNTAHAATINVDGSCSLSEAIRSANTDTSVAGCEDGAGADIIDIPEQTITLTSADPDGYLYGDSGLPLVTSEITIQGNGSTIERVSGDDFRIIALAENTSSVLLTLDSITLTGGRAVEAGYGAGGAIFVGYDFGVGTSSLTLNNTTISGNYSDGDGGAIFASSGTNININDSTLSNNIAVYGGGGIYADQVDSLVITDSTINANLAGLSGSGIWIDYSLNFDVIRSTISNNSALIGAASSYGGGIYADRVIDIDIINSTISNNYAITQGSGISLYASTMVMVNSTVSDNLGPNAFYSGGNNSFDTSATLINSVIANSQNFDCLIENYSVLTGSSNNWIEGSSCDGIGIAGGDPDLGSLSDNGGPTLTHAPQIGSGLAGAGLVSVCNNDVVESGDQRGEDRGTMTCFIGSVEGAVDEPPVIEVESTFFVIPIANGNTVVIEL